MFSKHKDGKYTAHNNILQYTSSRRGHLIRFPNVNMLMYEELLFLYGSTSIGHTYSYVRLEAWYQFNKTLNAMAHTRVEYNVLLHVLLYSRCRKSYVAKPEQEMSTLN